MGRTEAVKATKKKWRKLKPYKGRIYQGCLGCPPVEAVAPLGMIIAVGLGTAIVKKGRRVIFDENDVGDDVTRMPTLRKFENMARKDPDHDWRVLLDAPLRMREYQRRGENKWVLVRSGRGFA